MRLCVRGQRLDLGPLPALRRHPGLVAAIPSTKTKAKAGARGARFLVANRWIARVGFVVARPVAKRRVRTAVHDIAEMAESLPRTLNQLVEAGQELGLIEQPRRRPAAAYVLAGVAIGAGAVALVGTRGRT